MIELSPHGPHSPEYTRRVACVISDAVRVLNYATMSGADGLQYPADVYSLTGTLSGAMHGLEQMLEQVGTFLAKELERGALAVTEGPQKGRPGDAVWQATVDLGRAAEAAALLTEALKNAQNALSAVSSTATTAN